MRYRFLKIVVVFCLFILPRPLSADWGELALGLQGVGGYPWEGRAGVTGRFGLSDWWTMDWQIDIGQNNTEWVGSTTLGVIWAWDVWQWVPEVELALGSKWIEDRWRPLGRGSIGLRYYWGWDWSCLFRFGTETTGPHWLMWGQFGVLKEIL